MPAEDAVRGSVAQRSVLPLGVTHSARTTGIENEHLMSDASGLCEQSLAFIGEQQPVEMRGEASLDRSVSQGQVQGIGADHRHMRSQSAQGLEGPQALIDGESGPGQHRREGAGTGTDVNEAGRWKSTQALFEPAGLSRDVLDGDLDAQSRPVLVRIGEAGQPLRDPAVVVLP